MRIGGDVLKTVVKRMMAADRVELRTFVVGAPMRHVVRQGLS